MQRFQFNSRKAQIDIYKKMPSIEPNKKYKLAIEQVVFPQTGNPMLHGKELFRVERRRLETLLHTPALPNEIIFIPENVSTVLELVAQINHFLRSKLLQSTSLGVNAYDNTAGRYQYGLPVDFARVNDDWYTRNDAPSNRLKYAITCVFRGDGSVGFEFSVDGLKLFVIKFTELGKELFGYENDYLALGVNLAGVGVFEDYVDTNGVPVVSFLTDAGNIQSSLPANLNEAHLHVFTKIIYLHNRNEVVVETSLPLNTIVEVHKGETNYEHQLASYRIPHKGLKTHYDKTLFRTVLEFRNTQYIMENFNETHNEYTLTSTELQNFHIRLVNRKYVLDESGQYKKKHFAYELADNTFWYIQFLVSPA